MASPPKTPPHHPIHGVHMPPQTIEMIATATFPHHALATYRQLASGKSYNNRIYFLNVAPTIATSTPRGQDLVLKVIGRFFGAPKVQNEVSCLRMLETFCPDIPAPRIMAWSEDGQEAFLSLGAAMSGYRPDQTERAPHGGWILMTRVPGEPISTPDLDGVTSARLLRELADYVTQWRRQIPAQSFCGNLRFSRDYPTAPVDIRVEASEESGAGELALVIRGVLGEGLPLEEGVVTVADYYDLKVGDKIRQLETQERYAQNKELAPLLQSFRAQILPALPIMKSRVSPQDSEERPFLFTHYDLSPRNVLVSGTPLRITGIVDFEFAGFFSPLEEYLNDSVGNEGDWPAEMYEQYLGKLEENGIDTPRKGIPGDDWDQAKTLEQMVQNIAPWWVLGQHTGERLEELRESQEVVREALEKLGAKSRKRYELARLSR